MRRLPLYLGLLVGILLALALTRREALTSPVVLVALAAVALGVLTYAARHR